MMLESSWRVSFETLEDKLKTLLALLERHPYLPAENLAYNRNFVNIVQYGFEVLDKLDPNQHHTDIEPCLRLGADFHESSNLNYDAEKRRILDAELIKSYEYLLPLQHELNDIENDILTLGQRIRQQSEGDVTAALNKFFFNFCKLSPLLYDADGKAQYATVSDAYTHTMKLAAPVIENLYSDLLPQHLAPLLIRLANNKGFGNLHKVTRNILNQFVERVVLPATKLYSMDNNVVSKRTITLERIPPVYTPLRGALAGDCSMVSVPYYGLHNKVDVYWIRKSADYQEKPLGYVILVKIDTPRGELPYILTINGPTLKTIDCEVIFTLIAKAYRAEHIFVSDMEVNRKFVNSYAIADAFIRGIGERKSVSLPEGWHVLDGLNFEYENYYRSGQSSFTKELTSINNQMIERWHETAYVQAYPMSTTIATVPKLSRAILLYYFNRSAANSENAKDIQQRLHLTDDDVAAVSQLLLLYGKNQLTPTQFKSLHASFGFGLKEFAKLDFHLRASVLRWIYDECVDLFPETEWISVISKLNQELNAAIHNGNYSQNMLDNLKDYKASLPDIYIPNYWQEIGPFLYLDNGYPNHYLCKRFVKSFHSVGTIDEFIAYLLKNKVVLEDLDPEYDRWSNFFIRAMNLLDDNSLVQQAVKIAYVDHLKNTELRHTPYHLATTLVQYERIIGRKDSELMADIQCLHLCSDAEKEDFDKTYAINKAGA